MQPSITLKSESGLAFNTWGNMDLTDDNANPESGLDPTGEFTELDVTLSYDLPLDGPVGLTLGFIQYSFPASGAPGTRELLATVSAKAPLAPTLSVYADIDEAEGWYATFGLSHSVELGGSLSLGLLATLGAATDKYNAFYFGVDQTRLNDLNVGASLTWDATENLSTGVSATYVTLLDGDIRDGAHTIGYDGADALIYGVTLSWQF